MYKKNNENIFLKIEIRLNGKNGRSLHPFCGLSLLGSITQPPPPSQSSLDWMVKEILVQKLQFARVVWIVNIPIGKFIQVLCSTIFAKSFFDSSKLSLPFPLILAGGCADQETFIRIHILQPFSYTDLAVPNNFDKNYFLIKTPNTHSIEF